MGYMDRTTAGGCYLYGRSVYRRVNAAVVGILL